MMLSSVKEPPIFTQIPQPLEVTEGDVVELECRAKGKPLPCIDWYKDGQKVETSDSYRVETGEVFGDTLETESKVFIDSVLLSSHSGKYVIEAKNEVGTVTGEALLFGKRLFLWRMRKVGNLCIVHTKTALYILQIFSCSSQRIKV